MYLKSIEMVGFKSFADKTRLAMEPGITSIVGPNGCGKSNVSDALRWVLGEQSAKALRGAKMEDCIFNGTQNRKPLGMAEVNITFTACEGVLNTEFHEVTVTRRVFRSGEGQYFINRTPCRLKDVQRLFMDTGIGTASYSFMAQGRIDQILSARPEDRRAIFEEASGITKYKTDKREAMRKLEHTEANLIRLADVIREVKRQIGSLQRQAGKARRYKSLKDELRDLDMYATRHRLRKVNAQIRQVQADLEVVNGSLKSAHVVVEELQGRNAALHEEMLDTERRIAAASEAALDAQGKLDRAQDMIRMNRQRIDEYREWSERDTREADELNRQLAEQQGLTTAVTGELEAARAAGAALQAELASSTARHNTHRDRMQAVQSGIQAQRDKALELDALATRLQNQLVDLENRERSNIVQRERLAAEKSALANQTSELEARLRALAQELERLRGAAAEAERRLESLQAAQEAQGAALAELRQRRGTLLSEVAAQEARLEMLSDADTVQGDFPPGAQWLLDAPEEQPDGGAAIAGALAALIDVAPSHARALETALRSVIDAVVIRSGGALREVLAALQARGAGAARLLCLESDDAAAVPVECGAPRLLDHCTCLPELEPLLQRLLGNVFTVAGLEAMPAVIPAGATFVTAGGLALGADGRAEFWMPAAGETNPLARKHAIAAVRREAERLRREIAACEQAISAGAAALEAVGAELREARRELDAARRSLAQKEGEEQLVVRDAASAVKRLETVSFELDDLTSRSRSWDAEKTAIADRQQQLRADREQVHETVATQNRELQQLESQFSALQTELTEKRIGAANAAQRIQHMEGQLQGSRQRMAQLEAALHGRATGIESYQSGIRKLESAIAEAGETMAGLEAAVQAHTGEAARLRAARETVAGQLKAREAELAQKRAALEAEQQRKSELEVHGTELRMRSQNTTERITGDYHLSIDEIMEAHDPEFPEGAPAIEEAETSVAELRAKIEAMGPVNLVAIEEYQEYEERYTFLTRQEEDLVNARQQLTEMIQKINKTTSELFRETFERTNQNFQAMFERLFNGGNARLVLVDEEDILECGIEIIARPPGKRLQNISLLSGGERTLTAVALLFAIYMIKPSPFCLLDELDAPLDDSNIGRFIGVLKEFQQQSQFMVITHNRQTIAAANIIYGVTMPERGVSSIVSMRFKDAAGGIVTADGEEDVVVTDAETVAGQTR